jgi:hypothetical protein|tara:strand:- start:633 stop:1016 length:384 start_codon:yes stop_codon:yes gene_type:complete
VSNKYASGKHAIAICDRCGFKYKLKQLKQLTIKTKKVNILVCPECFEPDQPQLQVGMRPVDDPQGLRNPRVDTSYIVSGNNQTGSRQIQWGFNPVGLSDPLKLGFTNDLVASLNIGNVSINITESEN